MRRMMGVAALVVAVCLGGATVAVGATNVAVVNVEVIMAQSTLGKQAVEHVNKVREVLRKGFDEVRAVHGDSTPEARARLNETLQSLDRQLLIEQQGVNERLQVALEEAVKAWLKDNSKYDLVVSRQSILGMGRNMDFTDGVMKLMNKQTIEWPALPTVTVKPPAKK